MAVHQLTNTTHTSNLYHTCKKITEPKPATPNLKLNLPPCPHSLPRSSPPPFPWPLPHLTKSSTYSSIPNLQTINQIPNHGNHPFQNHPDRTHITSLTSSTSCPRLQPFTAPISDFSPLLRPRRHHQTITIGVFFKALGFRAHTQFEPRSPSP